MPSVAHLARTYEAADHSGCCCAWKMLRNLQRLTELSLNPLLPCKVATQTRLKGINMHTFTSFDIFMFIFGGLFFGFVCGSANDDIKTGAVIGAGVGLFWGSVLYFGSNAGALIASGIFVSSIIGGLVAALTPNDNAIKKYFNLSRQPK